MHHGAPKCKPLEPRKCGSRDGVEFGLCVCRGRGKSVYDNEALIHLEIDRDIYGAVGLGTTGWRHAQEPKNVPDGYVSALGR